MRRKDREITDHNKINDVIAACHCCRLGFSDAGKVYIVPLNFGFEEQDGKRVFYFHGAKEGRKIDLIAQSPLVGFEMDMGYELVPGPSACAYSARFQSIIGTGRVTFVQEIEEKKAGLRSIMRHNAASDGGWTFTDAMADSVCVFKLEVEELACKEHE